ncbi:MAG: LytTR family DNA-binding domain-containing protein [bacterium]
MTALIVDDEPLARRRLHELLGDVSWIALVGEAADGVDAVRMIDQLRPDLIFLDVIMPGLSGLEVLGHIQHRPTVVFTTAYDRFAVAAFEARALDYILKPFGRRRFASALERIRESIDDRDTQVPSVERARAALEPSQPLSWLFVRERGRVTPVNVANVVRFEGSDDYVTIHAGERRLLATLRMSDLETMLPPSFLRIHRSHIVNLEMVETFRTDDAGRFAVIMRDGTRLAVSRDRAKWLRERAI